MFGLIPFKNGKVKAVGDSIDDFVTGFFNDDLFSSTSDLKSNFKADIKETDKGYLVEAELPGVNKEDINLEYKEGTLVISAKRNEVIEDKKDNYIRKERHYGEFSRSFYVGKIDKNLITASFENGVLKIELPKDKTIIEESKITIS